MTQIIFLNDELHIILNLYLEIGEQSSFLKNPSIIEKNSNALQGLKYHNLKTTKIATNSNALKFINS